MASVNKVILVGNLGRDPETRYGPDGSAVTNVSIATTEKWKDKATGETKENTEWHRIVFFNRMAEIAGEYLRKGRSIYVEGRLRTRKWTDKDGNERHATEVIGDQMQMLGGRDGASDGSDAAPREASARPSPSPKTAIQSAGVADMDDDIPF